MELLDGSIIEDTSPGGILWEKITKGEQIRLLDTSKGQNIFDLMKVAEDNSVMRNIGGWLGSLSLSTSHGMPDDYTLDLGDVRDCIYNMQECMMISGNVLPILVDVDACFGNPLRTFAMLNVLQVAVGVTENKKADVVKINSLVSDQGDSGQMATVDEMLFRLKNAKKVQKNTLVAARVENLIYGYSPDETAKYILEVENYCDLILIHWNKSDTKLLFAAAKQYKKISKNPRPLIAVTTAYGRTTTPDELLQHGFNLIVYPNHVTRRQLFTAQDIYSSLLTDSSAGGVLDDDICPTSDVIHRFSTPGTFTYNRII
jgi:2-methylisocitrate lyase-like PEP mutase family enzyme